ncbi:hypothetical protein FHR71_004258 [Methylobacterium sp. RAS18]|nr:hypothetical protein [Methylobacterium sp. RAS18]
MSVTSREFTLELWSTTLRHNIDYETQIIMKEA